MSIVALQEVSDDNQIVASSLQRSLVALVTPVCVAQEGQIFASDANICTCWSLWYVLVIFCWEVTCICDTLQLWDERSIDLTDGGPIDARKEGWSLISFAEFLPNLFSGAVMRRRIISSASGERWNVVRELKCFSPSENLAVGIVAFSEQKGG